MSDLSFLEKRSLEQLFRMGSGYVLDFSNRTLQELVADTVGLDILSEDYAVGSGSKANRMRRFWEVEPNPVVARVLDALIQVEEANGDADPALIAEARRIATRLTGAEPVTPLAAAPQAQGLRRQPLTLGEPIGAGGVANGVYAARDPLWGEVAVKLLTRSAEQISTALEHAQPLARVNHPNVVRVHYVAETVDPVTGAPANAIVMERVHGRTLQDLLTGAVLSGEDATRIALGVADGLTALHAEGVPHTDLHEGNVMVAEDQVKIIDVFYRGTLRADSTALQEQILTRDRMDLIGMIRRVLARSALSHTASAAFTTAADAARPTADIAEALRRALLANPDHDVRLERAFQRIVETGFVPGDDYARMLLAKIDPSLDPDLLLRLIDAGSFRPEHGHLLRHLWNRMREHERMVVMSRLAERIDTDVPRGPYGPSLDFLHHLGAPGWNALDGATKARLENLIVTDIRTGAYDYHRSATTGGFLGSHARLFWRFFDRDRLFAALLGQLRNASWYTQNYVAAYFLELLPQIAGNDPERRAALQAALRRAVANDAGLVVAGIQRLPADWIREIRGEEDPF